MSKQAILCVDDEAIILFSMVQELRSFFGTQFIYEKALNAESALSVIDNLVLENVSVILIISDWFMPGLKGDEFLSIVHKRYPAINAIMITGQADREAIDSAYRNPSVIAVLQKPWNSQELKKLITQKCLQPVLDSPPQDQSD